MKTILAFLLTLPLLFLQAQPAPEIREPAIKAPEIKTPEIKEPAIKAPEIKTPEIKAPEVKTPEIKVPEVKAPGEKAPAAKPPKKAKPAPPAVELLKDAPLNIGSFAPAISPDTYQFIMLGDLHYDNTAHHTQELNEKKPEIKRNTDHWQDLAPRIITAAAKHATPDTIFAFQAGDITQGDAKSLDDQKALFSEVLERVSPPFLSANIPFLLVKGNHDFRSPGGGAAFAATIVPYLKKQLPPDTTIANGNYIIAHGPDLFVFIDCQLPEPTFIRKAIESRPNTRHLFIIDHLPVIPFSGGSPAWILFGNRQGALQAKRHEFRQLLAKHNAIVLCGHVHNNSFTEYTHPDEGRIAQATISSMLAKSEDYPPPRTEFADSKKFKNAMKNPTIKAFVDEYTPYYTQFSSVYDGGYAVIRVNGNEVVLDLYHTDHTEKPSLSWRLR